MKNIDMILSDQSMRPSRSLKVDFTSTIVAELNAHPKPHRKRNLLRFLKAKIGILSLGLLLVAGTAAAAVTTVPRLLAPPTPNVQANQSVAKELPNGTRVIGYNLQNCEFFSYSVNDRLLGNHKNERAYYEIKKGSKLTDRQIQTALQGTCEENIDQNDTDSAGRALENKGVAPKYGFGTDVLVVKKITPTSITTSLDPVYGHTLAYAPEFKDTTYDRYFNGLEVYDGNTPDTYSDIRVGDTVILFMDDTLGYAGTGATPAAAKANAHPELNPTHDIVYFIVKVPPLTASPDLFYTEVGSAISRVVTCTTDPSGYCAPTVGE